MTSYMRINRPRSLDILASAIVRVEDRLRRLENERTQIVWREDVPPLEVLQMEERRPSVVPIPQNRGASTCAAKGPRRVAMDVAGHRSMLRVVSGPYECDGELVYDLRTSQGHLLEAVPVNSVEEVA